MEKIEPTTKYPRECDSWMRQIHSWNMGDPMDGTGDHLKYRMCCWVMRALWIGLCCVAWSHHI